MPPKNFNGGKRTGGGGGAKKGGAPQAKKGGAPHRKNGGGGGGPRNNLKRAIGEAGTKNFRRNGPNGGAAASGSRKPQQPSAPKSARTKEVDIHLASRLAHDFTKDINIIKDKLQSFTFDGLDQLFRFVPPSFVMQHLPVEVSKFRTYFSKFSKGSKNDVLAFVKWYEWASYEAAKTLQGVRKSQTNGGSKKRDEEKDSDSDNDGEEAKEGEAQVEGGERKRKVSQSRATLQQVVKEREHMRALLQMCLRHNSTKRHEGQRALINHLNSHLTEQSVAKSYAALRESAHHSVSYAVSRLVTGMVTENFANVALYCHTLYLVLRQTPLHPKVLISLLGDSLDSKMKAQELRVNNNTAAPTNDEDDVDPDDISDPTKGERNQRVAAAVFTIVAIVAASAAAPTSSAASLGAAELQQIAKYLSYCFIEHKGIRVLTGNLFMALLGNNNADESASQMTTVLGDSSTWKWVHFAFFRFPKLEYFRPEAVQLLIALMQAETKPSTLISSDASSDQALYQLCQRDPLEPSMMEQIANALFRKDQVTLVHPMVHPVWHNILDLIKKRCGEGESLKQHLSTFVHTVIAPYRRGASESPRNTLFLKIVDMVGSLAMQHDDDDDRREVVKIATKTVGFGKSTKVPKTTPINELKELSLDAINDKIVSLSRQLVSVVDSEPAASATRTWAMRELRSCLLIPYREGTVMQGVDKAVLALLQAGFFPKKKSTDEVNMNRAVYLFADIFSFTFTKPGGLSRVKAHVSPLAIISSYLEAEEAKRTRFQTAVNHAKFRKARNRIVEALENDSKNRSVLFYDPADMRILLTLLFVMLSVDDHTNEAAINIAASVVPDLTKFYQNGTIETIDVLYDVMMSLVLRPTAPLHILPIMSSIRRIATGYLYRFARFIRDRRSLDLVLAPLVDGYNTNDREEARARGAQAGKDEEDDVENETEGMTSSASDDDDASTSDTGSDSGDEEAEVESDDEEKGENDVDEDADASSDDASTVADSEESADSIASDAEDDEEASDDSDDAATGSEADDTEGSESAEGNDAEEDDEWAEGEFVEEEKPTQQYLTSLQHLAGNIDLGFAYPTDTEHKEKSDVVRAINIATRVGLGMTSPLVVNVFQVLLAVMRSEVKGDDPVIFDAARSSIIMLMMSRQRYFGSFLPATDLLQLLGDIQTYCRKLARFVVPKEKAGSRKAAYMRKRLIQLKMLAVSVFHYTCFLAHKNHGDEAVQFAYKEFYQTIFYDRGWETKQGLPQLKRDLYHYRHGFAWALLPAVVEKFEKIKEVEGAQRVTAFNGACVMIESMLSRVSGLPQALKASVSTVIKSFLESVNLKELFDMKQTSLYNFFHAVKMSVEYNSKLNLDTDRISALVQEVVDDDSLQVTSATVRVLASIEKLLNMTPKARETKAPVPVQILYKQFEAKWRKDKSEFHRKANIARKKTAEALLAHRNDDPTDEERAKKRRRRDELKVADREERTTLRAMKNRDLTKEEKDNRRKRLTQAKQDRVSKNRDRKRLLHDRRQASFVRWRDDKLHNAE